MIAPGATLGMLGGGQLGRMFTAAARRLGYHVVVLDPDPDSPAGHIATRHLRAGYEDSAALDELARTCAAVSTEFENVPAAALERLAAHTVVRPPARAVQITQDRIREKTFLRDAGFPTAKFAVIRSEEDLTRGLKEIGVPAVLKVSRHGYDGKGQAVIERSDTAHAAWVSLQREACVLEARVPLDTEVSVVLARAADGAIATYPVGENTHRHGILDLTVVPAGVSASIARDADAMARRVAEKLEYVGVMAVEFFVSRGALLVNEIAPRPHNSGHYTLDACACSQFEQQVRVLCDLPLGETRLTSPVAMVNLLGDLWPAQSEPNWEIVRRHANAHLHLYGKRVARAGRKMGHFTVLDPDRDAAQRLARAVQTELAAAVTTPRSAKTP